MADVPYRPINEQTPTAVGMPYQRAPVSDETFGAASGRALSGLGETLGRQGAMISDALLHRQREQDANLATDANTAFMEKATALYDGYSKKLGRDAYEAFPEFKKSLDDLWNESVGTLQSDEAKRLFTQHTRRFYVASLSDGQGYANKQFQGWTQDAATGRAAALANQASLNINNPQQMQQFLAAGGAEVRKAAEAAGEPHEMAEQRVREYWGQNIKNIVSLQAKDDPQAAMATLQKFGPIMDPESRAQAAATLRPLARDQEADAVVNTALGVQNPTGARGSQAGGPDGYLNNVGNLRVSGADWIGKGSPYNGFETFSTPEQGVAAAYKNIRHIAEQQGGDISLVDLITTWAPASDGNSPTEYAATVGKMTGMDIEDDVPLDDAEQMTAIIKAMARVEKGEAADRIPESAYGAGVRAAMEGQALPNAPQTTATPGQWGNLPDKSSAVMAILKATEGDPDLQAAALSRLNSRYAVKDAVTQSAREQLSVQLPDVMRAAQMGDQTVTLPLDLMRQSGMSPDEFSATVTQFDTSKRIGLMTQGLAFAPEADLDAAAADIANLSGPIGAAINAAAGGPPGTGNQAMRLSLQSGAAAQIKKLKQDRQQFLFGDNADPAAYVASAPGVVAARTNLQKMSAMASRTNDPGVAVAATQEYAATILGVQAAMGVEPAKRRILTTEQAARTGQALSPQPGQSGEMAVKVIRDAAVSWGTAWPQVASEIGGNLSDIARVVAIMPQSQNFAAAKLVEFAGAQKDLEAGSKGEIGTEIKEASAAAWQDFLETFGSSGFQEGLQIAQAGELLTRGYVVLNGMSPGDAAELAYQQIIGSQYDVSEGVRIPKPYDAGLIVRGGEAEALRLLEPIAGPAGKAPGMITAGNIDLTQRPRVQNPDGSVSTVHSMSFRNDAGEEVLIPTVAEDGSRILTEEEAKEQYGRTGKFLGKFDTPENATAYAQALHLAQERFYGIDPVMDDLGAGAATHAQYMASLWANHSWVNDPSGRGLVLVDDMGRPVTSRGQPVFRSWQQLLDAAETPSRSGAPTETVLPTGPNLLDQQMQQQLQQLQ